PAATLSGSMDAAKQRRDVWHGAVHGHPDSRTDRTAPHRAGVALRFDLSADEPIESRRTARSARVEELDAHRAGAGPRRWRTAGRCRGDERLARRDRGR